MRASRLFVVAGSVIAIGMLSACAGTPQQKSPSWTKYQATGSRIPRTVNREGKVENGENVVTTAPQDLENLPSVTINTTQR